MPNGCESGHLQLRIATGSLKFWLQELAVRRCIWCWYGESEESMGLWSMYGARGVAVVSSIKRVRNAFSNIPHATGTSVGFVQYVRRQYRLTEARALNSFLKQHDSDMCIEFSPLLSIKGPEELQPAVRVQPRFLSTDSVYLPQKIGSD
jgi:hypothetical protein